MWIQFKLSNLQMWILAHEQPIMIGPINIPYKHCLKQSSPHPYLFGSRAKTGSRSGIDVSKVDIQHPPGPSVGSPCGSVISQHAPCMAEFLW